MALYIVAPLLCVCIASAVLLTGSRNVGAAIVNTLLIWLYPVTNDHGNKISGPQWQLPDGQIIDKFLQGRLRSKEWQVFGSVYRIWSCTIPEIVITTPEEVQIFHTDSQYHNKVESANAGWFFHQLLGDCMGLVNGTRWKNLRTEFDPSFSRRAVMQRSSDIEIEARRFVSDLKVGDELERFSIQTSTAFMKFPFFCTSRILYGPMTESDEDRLWSIGQTRLALMGHVIKGGIFRHKACQWLASNASKELSLFQKEWAAFNKDIYHSAKTFYPSPPIVSLGRSETEGRISEVEILQTLDEMLFANLDVTTHVLTWLITLLADKESTQQKLRHEIRNMRDSLDVYCNQRDTFLHFCLMEAIRLRPPAVFSIPESSPSVKRLGGFKVPKNTSVVVDILAINVRNPFWGLDSEKFMPERFRDMKQEDVSLPTSSFQAGSDEQQLRYNMFAFGFGPRKCLGQNLAERSIKMLVIHLIDRYRLSLRQGQSDQADYKVDEGNWIPLADVELDLVKLK
ncbi:MAG: hypothetical protein M1830_000723 [Pleopsidium flavum]|nr:MAG: hypothetical protein M1830_000723 [Pleopsidium flavum]